MHFFLLDFVTACIFSLKWLHSRSLETCSLSLKVWALNTHALAPDSTEGNRYPRPSYRGFINFMHDLLQEMWLLPSTQIFISSSEHLKQAKIVLSPWLFTTSIHSSNQWPERQLFRSVISMLDFLLHIRAPGKLIFGAYALSARTFSGSEQVSDAWLCNVLFSY